MNAIDKNKTVVVIAGPTASRKTEFAVNLAQTINGG